MQAYLQEAISEGQLARFLRSDGTDPGEAEGADGTEPARERLVLEPLCHWWMEQMQA